MRCMASFSIRLRELSSTPKSYRFAISWDWLREAVTETDLRPPKTKVDGDLEISLYMAGDTIVLKGTAKANLEASCVTCLDPVPLSLCSELDLLFSPAPDTHGVDPEGELEADGLDVEYYSGTTLDLDEIIRDNLLLEVPMQPRCGGDECKRAPSVSEDDLTQQQKRGIDPRLAALKSLSDSMKKN